MNNLGELKTEVQSWLDREDTAFTSRLDLFVGLAEDDIFVDLRCEHNEFVVTYDDSSAANAHKTLPENFKQFKRITWNGYPLDHVSDLEISERLVTEHDTDVRAFAMVERQLVLSAAVDDDPANWASDDELIITYFGTESLYDMPMRDTSTNPTDSVPTEATATVVTQSDTNTTRLLQHYPNIYLSGCLKHASIWLKDMDGAALHGSVFNNALDVLKREYKRAQFSGSAGGIRSAYGS